MGPGTARDMLPAYSIGIVGCLSVGAILVAVESEMAWLPAPIIALAAGVVMGRVLPGPMRGGSAMVSSYFLQAGIVLLGLRLSLAQLGTIGAPAAVVIVPCVGFAATATFALGRIFGVPRRLSLLLAAGTAVCGNSAIAAIAPSVEATDDEVAAAITTVTVYGTVALLLFPIIAGWMDLSARAFGIWTGTAINDTSQVLASAFSMSYAAGETATVVKLGRNLFIVPTTVVAAWFGRRYSNTGATSIHQSMPWFVFAFAGAVILSSLFHLPTPVARGASVVSKLLILTALTGIGIRAASVKADRRVLAPLAAGSLAGIALAAVSLSLVIATA